MKRLRQLLRFAHLTLHIVIGMLLTAGMAGLFRLAPAHRVYRAVKGWWLKRIVSIVGGRVTLIGQAAAPGALMVSNHVSWLDIPLLGGYAPVYFLSKSDVLDWPVVGWLAAKAGTLFIQRGGRDAARQAAEMITVRLNAAGSVLIFPEGTTTDGVNLLPFHARLFAAAVDAQALVQPVAIRYRDTQGQPHARVPYIGEQSMLDNLWSILAEPYLDIEVYFLPPVNSLEYPRKALAQYTETAVRTALGLEARRLASVRHSADQLAGQ